MIITHTKGKDKNSVCDDGNIKHLNIKGEIYKFDIIILNLLTYILITIQNPSNLLPYQFK